MVLNESEATFPVLGERVHPKTRRLMSYTACEVVDGEALARRILRDDEFAGARGRLTGDCARFLAGLHAIDPAVVPGLPANEPVAELRGMENTKYNDGGINVEGLAWDARGGRLLLGLRSPVVEGQDVVLHGLDQEEPLLSGGLDVAVVRAPVIDRDALPSPEYVPTFSAPLQIWPPKSSRCEKIRPSPPVLPSSVIRCRRETAPSFQ